MSAESKEGKQIRQMINFIMQESHEKCNEIRLKADHDYQLELQNLVHAGKLRVQEEYTQKEKSLEIQTRVSRSNAVANQRVTVTKARDELLEKLKKGAKTKIASIISNKGEYNKLLIKLISQGLAKIQERDIQVQCRSEDKNAVEKAITEAVKNFNKDPANKDVTVTVTLSKNMLPSKDCLGGVKLVAYNGRITVDQTLDERLKITYKDIMPQVRALLFNDA
jgi:V-type H+-transporting ATPase subunit E